MCECMLPFCPRTNTSVIRNRAFGGGARQARNSGMHHSCTMPCRVPGNRSRTPRCTRAQTMFCEDDA
eukprot:3009202-Alexandrium_andersonii.AAC.1